MCVSGHIKSYLQWCFFLFHYAYINVCTCSSEACSQEGKEKGTYTCIVYTGALDPALLLFLLPKINFGGGGGGGGGGRILAACVLLV